MPQIPHISSNPADGHACDYSGDPNRLRNRTQNKGTAIYNYVVLVEEPAVRQCRRAPYGYM